MLQRAGTADQTVVTQGLAELPLYWGYVAPRLRAFGFGRWTVIGLVGVLLLMVSRGMAIS